MRSRSSHSPNHSPNSRTRLFAIALLTFAAALPFAHLAAQDLIVGTPVTFKGLDDGQNLKPLKLEYTPKPLRPTKKPAPKTYEYAIAFSPSENAKITDKKYSENAPMSFVAPKNTSWETGIYCTEAIHDWRWDEGAYKKDDPRQAWVAMIFNPPSASGSKKNTAPRLLDVAPVFLPVSEIAPDNRSARVDVTVGVSGEIKNVRITTPNKVTSKNETAITDTVSKWKIAPAIVNGVPTEATINVPVLFLAGNTKPNLITQLKPTKENSTIYPIKEATHIEWVTRASVTLEFTLDDQGCPKNPIVVFSPDKIYAAPALQAILGYRFEIPDPSKPDSLGNTYAKLSEARWQYVVNFWYSSSMVVNHDYESDYPNYSLNQMTSDDTTWSKSQRLGQNIDRPVLAPKSVRPVAPVYPYQLLKANIIGNAAACMPCSLNRKDDYPSIIDASKKEFGLALAAALYYYKIMPASFMGKPTPTMLNVTFDFNPANPELRLSEKTKQLLADETKAPKTIIPEGKLDKRLKIRQDAPASSTGLLINAELKGTTVVEFLVDETGRVHLPRIIKTSAPEAAYLLMQQISMRVYDPPMQNGKPVVARAREEVNLDAMKK